MGEEFNIKQEVRPAELFRLSAEPDVQVYLTELEVDEGVLEVVLHVFDETLQNFVAKRILLNVRAAEQSFAAPAAGNEDV